MTDDLIARLRSVPPGVWDYPLVADSADVIEELRAENERLMQIMWDAHAALGYDHDGDPTPAAACGFDVYFGIDVQAFREDYDAACAENERLKAVLAGIKEYKDLQMWSEDYGNEVDQVTHELDKLRAAVGGLSPEATRWAIRIARETIKCRTTDEPAALTRFYDLWYALTPEVRAQILGSRPMIMQTWHTFSGRIELTVTGTQTAAEIADLTAVMEAIEAHVAHWPPVRAQITGATQ